MAFLIDREQSPRTLCAVPEWVLQRCEKGRGEHRCAHIPPPHWTMVFLSVWHRQPAPRPKGSQEGHAERAHREGTGRTHREGTQGARLPPEPGWDMSFGPFNTLGNAVSIQTRIL